MKIVIIGAGGHGRVVLDILRNNHQFEVAGFLDSNTSIHGQTIDGIKALGEITLAAGLMQKGIGGAIIAIGDNRIRDHYARQLEEQGVPLVNAIHPSATIAGNAVIGKNVVIAAGVTVCTHVKVEDSVILNTGCIVDHESTIKKASHICPGVKLAGHVTVKELAFIGIGATVIQGVTVHEYGVVGAGAVVLEDVDPYATVVGVPARMVKSSHLNGMPVPAPAASTSARGLFQPSTADMEPARSIIGRPVRRRVVDQQKGDETLEVMLRQ